MTVRRLNTRDADFPGRFEAFLGLKRDADSDVGQTVTEIIADVRRRGDAALIEYTRRFDRLDCTADSLRIGEVDLARLAAPCPADVRAALALAAVRIRDYHARQVPENMRYTDPDGVTLGARWTPVDAAGLYVPGGMASYPSSVLMNAIPAKAAGVKRLVMVVPTPDGTVNPAVMAAAEIAGVDEVYRIGGAQAIAALAWGTATIAPVDKIVGPGNRYVAEAKRQVFGKVGIDMIAGPSEILVVADAANDPRWIAADLLSQAEHDETAQSVLITEDAGFADAVAKAVGDTLAALPRAGIAGKAWREFGAIIVAEADTIPALVDAVAPEHLELAVADPDALAGKIRHAGAIFLGRHTPEAIGDYIAGPSHVLPTGGTARFSSGLSVIDFMKRTSLIGCTPQAFAAIGEPAARLADAEGLGAHALSLRLRSDHG